MAKSANYFSKLKGLQQKVYLTNQRDGIMNEHRPWHIR